MIDVTEDESLVCVHSIPSAPVWAVPGVVDCLAPQEGLLGAVAQHLLHLPHSCQLTEVGDCTSVPGADVAPGANLQGMEVAFEAQFFDVGGKGSVFLTFPCPGFLYPLDSVEGDGEFHQLATWPGDLPLVQDHIILRIW